MLHPWVFEQTCDLCEKFVFDQDHKLMHWKRTGQPMTRQATPVCSGCPKCPDKQNASPQQGRKTEASLVRAMDLLQLYYESQATFGRIPLDSYVRRDLGIAASIVEHAKLRSQAMMMGLAGLGGGKR